MKRPALARMLIALSAMTIPVLGSSAPVTRTNGAIAAHRREASSRGTFGMPHRADSLDSIRPVTCQVIRSNRLYTLLVAPIHLGRTFPRAMVDKLQAVFAAMAPWGALGHHVERGVDAVARRDRPVALVGSDSTAPTTTAMFIGLEGRNGWYRGPVTVTLRSDSDDTSGTFCTVDGGPLHLCSTPFTISEDGIHRVSYSSTDTNGNQEPLHTVDVKIDSISPTVTATATPPSLWPANRQMVAVTIRGMLADVLPGAGIDRSTARFAVTDTYGQVQPNGTLAVGAGGSFQATIFLEARTNPDDLRGRTYTIGVSIRDLAGNLGVGTTVVRVPHDRRQ